MKLLVLLCLTYVCVGEKNESQIKDKRQVSTVQISSPYSQVRYAPGYPSYEGQLQTFHGKYAKNAKTYGYPMYPPPVFVPEHPGLIPQHPGFIPQHPGFIPQHPGFIPQHPGFIPQHPGFIPQHPGGMPQPRPPVFLPPLPCEGETETINPMQPNYPTPPPIDHDAEPLPPPLPQLPKPQPPSKVPNYPPPPISPPSPPPQPPPMPMQPSYPSYPPPPQEEDSYEDEPEPEPPMPLPPKKPPTKTPPPPPPTKPPIPSYPSYPPPPEEEDSYEEETEPPMPIPPKKPPTKIPPPPPPKPPTKPPIPSYPSYPPPPEEEESYEDEPEPEPPIPMPPKKPPMKRPPPPQKPQMPPVHYPPTYPWPSQPPTSPPVEGPPDCEQESHEDEPEQPQVPPMYPRPSYPSRPPPPVEEESDEHEPEPPKYLPPKKPPTKRPPPPPQQPPSMPMYPRPSYPSYPPPPEEEDSGEQVPPQRPPSRPMKPNYPPQNPNYPPQKPDCENEEEIPQIPSYPITYLPPARPIVPPYQHRPAGNQRIIIQHPANVHTVPTASGYPAENPYSPQSSTPRPQEPSSPRTPYQPPYYHTYYPSYDTGPQFFPPQDIYNTNQAPAQNPQKPNQPTPAQPRPQEPSPPRTPQRPSYTPQYDNRPQYYPPQDIYVTNQTPAPSPQKPNDVPIPEPPPSSSPPTHLPEIPARPRPQEPSPPRPYQPPYIPQYYPPQAPVTPNYYPYYPYQPHYVTQHPYTYSRNTQKVSPSSDSGKQRGYVPYSGVAMHNNGQFLIETTGKSYPMEVTTQTPYMYNNPYSNQRVQNSNNFASESPSTVHPVYRNPNDGHYITAPPNSYRQTTTTTVAPPTHRGMTRFEVRRPAIQKQFYDVEEKLTFRPVGSVIMEIVDPQDSSKNVMKIAQKPHDHPRNSTGTYGERMKNYGNRQYNTTENVHSRPVAINANRHHINNSRFNHPNRTRFNSNPQHQKPGVTYADQGVSLNFMASKDLMTPKHTLSPAAQVTQNKTKTNDTKNDSEEEDDDAGTHSAAYLYGRDMIKVKENTKTPTTTPCPPSKISAKSSKSNDYNDYPEDDEDYANGVNISSNGENGLRANGNNAVETTTEQNQQTYLEMLSGRNGITEVQDDINQNKNNADNHIQGRLLKVMSMQEASATEQPMEHTSVRRIMVSRPVETVQIVEMPEYKESQNQQFVSSNEEKQDNINNTQYISTTTTPTRMVYSNRKVETQTITYEN